MIRLDVADRVGNTSPDNMGHRRGLAGSLFAIAEVMSRGFMPQAMAKLQAGGLLQGADRGEAIGGSSAGESEADAHRVALIAARHEELFGYLVPPFEGVFLHDEGQIGGVREGTLIGLWRQTGLNWEADGAPVEHVATCCRLLGNMLLRPWQDAQTHQFLSGHLMGWLPALVHAWRRNDFADYAEVGDVLLILCVFARRAVAVPGGNGPAEPASEQEAPETPLPTADSGAGIREIASHLALHAKAGFFVGRGLVMRLGRGTGTPRGFGGTELMLSNLLRTAGHLGHVDAVVRGLDEEAAGYAEMWQTVAWHYPEWASWSEYWCGRIEQTRKMLADIREGVASLATSAE